MLKGNGRKLGKWSFVLLAVVLLIGALAGCTPKKPPVDPGGEKEVRDSVFIAISSIGNTLDMAFANFTNTTTATSHIYDRLIEVDESFQFEAGIADSWEYVDNLTFKFHVADGFVFHNDEPLTMDDVIFSIERLRTIPKLASVMQTIGPVEQTGDREVTITLTEPDSSIIRGLMANVHVFNKAYCESAGDEAINNPIGTGPYTVKNFVPGDRLELEAWENYPFTKPAIKHITFKTIEEAANRYISMETGEAQFTEISFQDMDRAETNPDVDVLAMQTTNTAFISMNTQKAPFDNTNVRLAMAHATDKEALATVKGGSTVIQSMTPMMFSNYYESPLLPKYDLEKAKALLEQEGYNDANPLKFETWIYGGNSSVMETFQASMESIGVEMTIKNLEFGVFLEGMANMEYQMLAGSWNNTTGNPLGVLANYWSGSFGQSNISFFQNARCDELYELAKATSDQAVIDAAVLEVGDIAAREMPIIPTFSSQAIFVQDKGLKGVRILPSSVYSLRKAYFE